MSVALRAMNVERRGRIAYGPMLDLQQERHAAVRDGLHEDTLFLLEHFPVVTFGRNARREHMLVSDEMLDARGIEVFESGRGGDVTYHGPGQLVGYPILKLARDEQDLVRYVTALEEIMVRTAADFGVTAERREKMRGVWVGNDKLGAVGVRVASWTTLHGFALNVSTDLSPYAYIVPCGLHGTGITSLERLLGASVTMHAVQERVVTHAAEVFARRPIEQGTPGRIESSGARDGVVVASA